MESIYFSERIPKSYKRAIVNEKEGYTEYLTSTRECYKEYDCPVFDERINHQLGAYNDSITLPRLHIFLNGEYKGLVKRYIKGKDLNNMSEVIPVRTFVEALKKFENDLVEYSNQTGLYLSYIDPSDIVWYSDHIYDVNTDRITDEYHPSMNPVLENMKELSNTIGRIYYNDEFYSRGLENLRMESLVDGTIRPSWVMDSVLEKYDTFADIYTLKDYKDGLKLIRK